MLIALAVSLFLSAPALAISDEVIKQRIEERAVETLELTDTTVRIDVGDGVVVLSGTVRFYAQKLIFDRIAWRTEGVEEVDNEIRVNPMLPLDDQSIKRKIHEIIRAHPRLHGIGAQIRVEKGAVFIRAAFRHPRDDVFLKHRVAEIEGVTAIEIDPTLIS